MSTSPPTCNRFYENQSKIDPPIYPDSKLAMQVPAERYAYVAALDPDHKSHSDALLVVDVDPTSRSFGEVPERADLPDIGDELHHFGLERVQFGVVPLVSGSAYGAAYAARARQTK
jgi:56kDa selenium binding protein (SBP56)